MKVSKNTILAFALLILVAALYRIIPNRPAGFAPHMALALFGGSILKDRKWAIALPLISLFLSDLFYQALYAMNLTDIPGIYGGQWQIYLCFVVITLFGFLLQKRTVGNIFLFSVSGSLIFFMLSNFLVWAGGGGFNRPKTFEGLVQCYADALVFYRDAGLIHGFAGNFILGELVFTIVLFGGYYLLNQASLRPRTV